MGGVWTVDAQDEEQRIPRVVHPSSGTLTDAPCRVDDGCGGIRSEKPRSSS